MWRVAARQAGNAIRRRSSCTGAFLSLMMIGAAVLGTSICTYGPSMPSVQHHATGLTAAVVFAAASLAFAPAAWAAGCRERTFIMVKPDGVHRGLLADIIGRFESKGYKLVAIKVVVPSSDLAEHHYAEHKGKKFFPGLVAFLSSGAVVAMVWEGKEVIKSGRSMIGATNPLVAAPGTIRGDHGLDVGRNIVHGSDSAESAQAEIALWFKAEDLAQYELHSKQWTEEL